MWLKDSCFPDGWKVSSVIPLFDNVWEWSTAKNYCPVSLVSVVSKVFEKLVSNRIVDHLEKCDLFSDFQYGFRSSWSTGDLLAVVSGVLLKLNSYGILGQIFNVISSFLSIRRFQVVLDGQSSQEYPVSAVVSQGSILGPTLFLLDINDLPDDLSVILLSLLIIRLSTLNVIWAVATTRNGFWTCVWSMRHCGLGHEVAGWFQYCSLGCCT